MSLKYPTTVKCSQNLLKTKICRSHYKEPLREYESDKFVYEFLNYKSIQLVTTTKPGSKGKKKLKFLS